MSINKADAEALGGLHKQLADVLTEAITDGVLATDKDGAVILDENGKPLRHAAPAALLSVARQFLKDNKIEALPIKGSPLDKLAGLPEFNSEGDNVVPLRFGEQW
jgi:hypothetical protein